MQTKFVYVMFYNSVLNSLYVVNFIILQSQGEKKIIVHFVMCLSGREYTLLNLRCGLFGWLRGRI